MSTNVVVGRPTAPPTATDRNGFPDPPFWLACKSALMSGSTQAIILHLNTRDYALPGKFLVPFLTGRLATRDIVAIYNRSSGIRFPMPTMEQKAKDLLGLDKPTQAPANPAFAALAAVTGQQSAPAFDWPKAPAAALALLEKLMLADARVTVILEYAETLLPAADLPMMSPDDRNLLVTLLRWGTDPTLNAAGNFAFLLVQNLTDLHPALRAGSSGYYAIEVPLPDREARRAFIEWYLETQPITSDLGTDEFANITAGLSLIHIENILLKAALAGTLTRDLVRAEKTALIAQEYAGLLEMMDPTNGFEIVGGMEQLKAWAQAEIIRPVRENRLRDMPQGVIFVGPPGTGKTFFVKALGEGDRLQRRGAQHAEHPRWHRGHVRTQPRPRPVGRQERCLRCSCSWMNWISPTSAPAATHPATPSPRTCSRSFCSSLATRPTAAVWCSSALPTGPT